MRENLSKQIVLCLKINSVLIQIEPKYIPLKDLWGRKAVDSLWPISRLKAGSSVLAYGEAALGIKHAARRVSNQSQQGFILERGHLVSWMGNFEEGLIRNAKILAYDNNFIHNSKYFLYIYI